MVPIGKFTSTVKLDFKNRQDKNQLGFKNRVANDRQDKNNLTLRTKMAVTKNVLKVKFDCSLYAVQFFPSVFVLPVMP